MLTEKAMTVNLTISGWTARKHDRSISKEVEEQHDAHNAGRYNKLLIAKEHIDKIQKAGRKIRDFHYDNTLPWGDNGDRLLPTENFQTYGKELAKLKKEYEQTVEEFLNDYPNLIEEARQRLGLMFNERDYPSVSQLRNKYGVKSLFLPVQEGDFRVALDEEELKRLQQEAFTELRSRLNLATQDLWDRVHDQLTHMFDRLSDEKAVFKGSMFKNLQEMVEVVPRLNVTADPELNSLCEKMRNLVHDPEAIRKNPQLRAALALRVKDLLDEYQTFF